MWQISGRLRTTGEVTLFPRPNQKFCPISAKNFRPIACWTHRKWTFIITIEIEITRDLWGFMEILFGFYWDSWRFYGDWWSLWRFMGISNPQFSHCCPFKSLLPFSPHNLGDPLVSWTSWKKNIEPTGKYSSTPVWWHRVTLSTTILKVSWILIVWMYIYIYTYVIYIYTYVIL